jgi:murein DD-endopeptidase MepM/ murein hydrolase activator NlpD
MTFLYRSIFFCGLSSILGLVCTLSKVPSAIAQTNCSTPTSSRIKKHPIARGETLESIAQQYQLKPETIINMNPHVNNSKVTVGNELKIPPFDGIIVKIPQSQTWEQVAANYQVTPESLLVVNGCEQNPRVVFVPVLPKSAKQSKEIIFTAPRQTTSTTITGYPLDNFTTTVLAYGWQIHPITGKVFFHSGVDLVAELGTPVKAIAPGIVVFAKEQTSYGNVVIINHADGLQTRYAQLETIQVNVGQKIQPGDILGTVGATGQPTSRTPHLHFEIRADEDLGWTAKDPNQYLSR